MGWFDRGETHGIQSLRPFVEHSMHAFSNLSGFCLPTVMGTTSIQETFIQAMRKHSTGGRLLRYTAHPWVQKHRKGLWRTFVGSMGGGALGLMGTVIGMLVAAPQTFISVSAVVFMFSVVAWCLVAMIVGYSMQTMIEPLSERTRQRFLRLAVELAQKDKSVRPVLLAYSKQLRRERPEQWWASVCVSMEEYNNALNSRAQWRLNEVEVERLEEVLVELVHPATASPLEDNRSASAL